MAAMNDGRPGAVESETTTVTATFVRPALPALRQREDAQQYHATASPKRICSSAAPDHRECSILGVPITEMRPAESAAVANAAARPDLHNEGLGTYGLLLEEAEPVAAEVVHDEGLGTGPVKSHRWHGLVKRSIIERVMSNDCVKEKSLKEKINEMKGRLTLFSGGREQQRFELHTGRHAMTGSAVARLLGQNWTKDFAQPFPEKRPFSDSNIETQIGNLPAKVASQASQAAQADAFLVLPGGAEAAASPTILATTRGLPLLVTGQPEAAARKAAEGRAVFIAAAEQTGQRRDGEKRTDFADPSESITVEIQDASNDMVHSSLNDRYRIIEGHLWFCVFLLVLVANSCFLVATLILRHSELADTMASEASATAMSVVGGVSIVVSIWVLYVRWFHLRPIMALIKPNPWVHPKNAILSEGEFKVRVEQAIRLERKVGLTALFGEHLLQAVLSVIAAVYLQPVTTDICINIVGAICASVRVLWVTYSLGPSWRSKGKDENARVCDERLAAFKVDVFKAIEEGNLKSVQMYVSEGGCVNARDSVLLFSFPRSRPHEPNRVQYVYCREREEKKEEREGTRGGGHKDTKVHPLYMMERNKYSKTGRNQSKEHSLLTTIK